MDREIDENGELVRPFTAEATKGLVRRLLEEIAESAQEHPLFLGWPNEISVEEVDEEGGDAAFITADIAWKAKKALEALAT